MALCRDCHTVIPCHCHLIQNTDRAVVVSPPTDRAALRDRIAEVLWPLADWDGDRLRAEAAADAVTALLAPTEFEFRGSAQIRANVLREAADRMSRKAAALTEGLDDLAIFVGKARAVEAEILNREAAELRRVADEEQPAEAPREWCKCPSCWGWFVEEHPGEDLDELGKDLGWWSGLPEHRDAPAEAQQQPETEAGPVSLATPCVHCGHPYNWHASRGACEFGNEVNRCGCRAFSPGEKPAPVDPRTILGIDAPVQPAAADSEETRRG